MKQTFSIISKILGWLALTIAFACIGLGSDKPALMVPIWGITFLLIISGIYLYLSMHKRRTFNEKKASPAFPMTAGAILLIFSILFPALILSNFLGDLLSFSKVVIFTIILLGLGIGGVICINILSTKNLIYTILGYILVTLCATFPGLAVAQLDASVNTMGVLYFTIAFETAIAWTGSVMLSNGIAKM